MNQLISLVLTFATAVHTVFGCCWHHAQVGGEGSQSVAATECSCHSNASANCKVRSPRDQNPPSSVSDSGKLAPASVPLDRPSPRDHQCHGSKCVGLLAKETQDVDNAGAFCPVGPAPATITGQFVSVDSLDGSRKHLSLHEPVRPIRAHLLLRVLLI